MKLNTKKNILIVGEDLSVKGGITSVLRAYLNSPLKEEFQLRHLTTLVEGTQWVKIIIFLRAFFRFIGLIILRKVDLVHIHSSSYASFYRKSILVLLAKIFRIPLIFHIHGSRFHHFHKNAPFLMQKWISWTLNRVEQIVVLSLSWQKRVSAMTRNSQIMVLNNPVNLAEMTTVASRQTSGEFIVLFLGELTQRKGVFDLLTIAEALCPQLSQLKFILAGNGELEKIHQFLRQANLQEQVLVPGWIGAVQRENYLQQADLFILPSYDEGLPVALLEAMAHGLPVVSTFAGGIPELVTSGINGLLVQPGNREALKRAVQSMIEDPGLREKFAAANRQKIETEYDIKIIAEQVRLLYLRLAR